MKSINVTGIKIKLLPLLKLTTATGASIGWVLGVLGLIASFFGGPAAASIFGHHFQGVAAGLINVIWAPVLFSVIVGVLTLASYWPCVWLLRLMGGFRLELESEESNRSNRASDTRREELLVR